MKLEKHNEHVIRAKQIEMRKRYKRAASNLLMTVAPPRGDEAQLDRLDDRRRYELEQK